MNKVITIHLNGISYQLEENGYAALSAYLETAGRRLEGNPDKDEILADIEQAIADKFAALLSPGKNVILSREVTDVLGQMGPVEDGSQEPAEAMKEPAAASGSSKAANPSATGTAPRRLYKLREGAKVDGVCNGIAAYLNIDVTIVRVAFILFSLLYGTGILVYVILMLALPTADSPQEKAAAQHSPTTAEEFVRRAKEGYYEGMKTWGDRQARREWKRKFRQDMRTWKWNLKWHAGAAAEPWRAPAPAPVMSPIAWFMFSLSSVARRALTIIMLLAVFWLITKGTLFGWYLPSGIPTWLGVILVLMFFQMLKAPLRVFKWRYYAGYPCFSPLHWLASLIGWIFFAYILIWIFGHHPSDTQRIFSDLDNAWHDGVHQLKAWWDRQ